MCQMLLYSVTVALQSRTVSPDVRSVLEICFPSYLLNNRRKFLSRQVSQNLTTLTRQTLKALYLSMRVENRLRCCVFSSLQLCSYATRKVEQLPSTVAFDGQDFNHPGFAEFDPAQSVALTHVPETDSYTVWAMEGCVERFCLSEQSIADVKICRDVALVVHDYGQEQAAAEAVRFRTVEVARHAARASHAHMCKQPTGEILHVPDSGGTCTALPYP